METVTDFIFLGSKITAVGDCSREIKRCRVRVKGAGGAGQGPGRLTHWYVHKKKGEEEQVQGSGCQNVPVWRPGSGCFEAEVGALGADSVHPRPEAEEPAPRQLVPAMACSSRTPDDKTNG